MLIGNEQVACRSVNLGCAGYELPGDRPGSPARFCFRPRPRSRNQIVYASPHFDQSTDADDINSFDRYNNAYYLTVIIRSFSQAIPLSSLSSPCNSHASFSPSRCSRLSCSPRLKTGQYESSIRYRLPTDGCSAIYSVTSTTSANIGGVSYTPGPQVGPSSYVGPSAAPSAPVSPTNTGPVGGAINAAGRVSAMSFDGKIVSLSLVGVVAAGVWIAAGM